jgi:hypothetical protein
MVYSDPQYKLGKLVNLLELAYEKGIVIADPVLDAARIDWAMARHYEQRAINQER